MKSTIKYAALVTLLVFASAGASRMNGVSAAEASPASSASKKAPAKPPAPAALSVFATCNNSSGPCTAQAACPASKNIVTGTAFYIVPDGNNAAFGICGTGSTACQPGVPNCLITSAVEGCANPGWKRQVVSVSINCQ